MTILKNTVLRSILTEIVKTASDDQTREHLNCVHFDERGMIESTDGHRLVRVTLATPFSHGGSVSLADIAGVLAALKVGHKPGETEIQTTDKGVTFLVQGSIPTVYVPWDGSKFPPADKVIPQYTKGKKQSEGHFGINPRYLAEAMALCVAAGENSKKAGEAVIFFGDPLDPIVVTPGTVRWEGVKKVECIVMPMRV